MLRSTGQTDRNAALAIALEYERAAKLARRGELVEAQAREVLKDIMKRADIGETIQTTTIRKHFDGWIASKEARKSEATAERYRMAVKAFLKTLGKRADKPLTSLMARDVEKFLNERTEEGLSPATLNLDVKIIGGALNVARRQGLIPTNPAEAVELPEVESMERGTFTPAEVKMLVDAAEGEWKLLIPLAYYTAARLGDCCRMQWDGVDLAGAKLTYTQSKTGKKVTVAIHPDLLVRLEEWAGKDKAEVFILPKLANERIGGRRGLSETFKKIMKAAGLDAQMVDGKGKRKFSKRSFHSLRHSANSEMANKGVAQEVRMKVTGHKSVREHEKYTHHEMDTLRKAVNQIPSLG